MKETTTLLMANPEGIKEDGDGRHRRGNKRGSQATSADTAKLDTQPIPHLTEECIHRQEGTSELKQLVRRAVSHLSLWEGQSLLVVGAEVGILASGVRMGESFLGPSAGSFSKPLFEPKV